jgi:serine/threonine-protein kinase RsbW
MEGLNSDARPRRKHAREHKIIVASKLENLNKIGNFVADIGRQLALPKDFIFDVRVAVDEACTNVIQHAYSCKTDKPISVGCRLRNREFIVRIRDFGQPFAPDSIARPRIDTPLQERRLGGLGMQLIKKLMNRVKYRFDERRGNELTMMKRLPEPGAPVLSPEATPAPSHPNVA